MQDKGIAWNGEIKSAMKDEGKLRKVAAEAGTAEAGQEDMMGEG